jgi:membrane protein YqaA with SNARE-associated domain
MAIGAILMALAPSVLGAATSGAFGLWGNSQNQKAAEKQQAEARAMAERQFTWGQQMDRFGMNQQNEQLGMQKQQLSHSLSRDRISQINEMLRGSKELQNQVRSLWGGRR